MAPLETDAVDHESSVLRYYTSQLMLRHIASDDYDPDGASFAVFGATETAPFLSIYESSGSILSRTQSIIVLPTGGGKEQRMTRGVFTVIPPKDSRRNQGNRCTTTTPLN